LPEHQEAATTAPHLSVALRHTVGALTLDVRFDLTQPWTILFGPSGSGKTTILRAIAGLLVPESGCIRTQKGGATTTLLDTDSGVNLPPHRRSIPIAPQTPALFPHLTVRKNLEYGGSPVAGTASLFGTDALLSRFPAQLSGGEAQRVNLARAALSQHARLLLLDEPFTGLDMALREELMGDLLQLQKETGVPILSVTHDVSEALRLKAEVIRLRAGKIVGQGPAHDVLGTERAELLSQLQPD